MNPIIYYESMDQLGGSAVQANLGSACSWVFNHVIEQMGAGWSCMASVIYVGQWSDWAMCVTF